MVHLVGVALVSAAMGAQSPDPHAMLLEAAAALAAVQRAQYEARLEMTAAATQRVVTGHVTTERGTDDGGLLGGRVAVTGEVGRGSGDAEKFELCYDGKVVRRFQARAGSVLQAEPGHGGEGLLQGAYGGLILRELLESQPLTEELAAVQVSYDGRRDIDGHPADVIAVTLADGGTVSRWYLDATDRLPRRVERSVRSSSGRDVQWNLTLSDLKANGTIDPTVFRTTAMEKAGTRVQVMGQAPAKTLVVGDEAPDWTLKDPDGVEHKLSDYKGKLVVLDFWASWCPHCREAMPAMQKMHEKYGDRGVAILGVNCREKGPVDAGAFAREKGCTYTVLVDSGEVAPKYKVKGIPAFFVVGPDGKILLTDAGFNAAKETVLIGLIEKHLAGAG